MQISARHIDLFPTRLWTFDLTGLVDYFPIWQSSIENMRQQCPTPAGRSNRSGWNSNRQVFADPLFEPLLKAAQQAFIYALKQTDPEKNLRFGLEAWANINDPGGYNIFHVHQNVLLSGCFYLNVPNGAGNITFRDPRPGVVLSPFEGAGVNANQTYRIAPSPGLLVLFPNWLEHAVETHEGLTPRISIPMNALSL